MLTRIYYCLCAFYYRCHLLSIHDCELNKTFSPIDLSFAQIILKKIVFNNIDPNIKSLSTFFNCLKKEFILLNCLILNPLLVCISFKKAFYGSDCKPKDHSRLRVRIVFCKVFNNTKNVRIAKR